MIFFLLEVEDPRRKNTGCFSIPLDIRMVQKVFFLEEA